MSQTKIVTLSVTNGNVSKHHLYWYKPSLVPRPPLDWPGNEVSIHHTIEKAFVIFPVVMAAILSSLPPSASLDILGAEVSAV